MTGRTPSFVAPPHNPDAPPEHDEPFDAAERLAGAAHAAALKHLAEAGGLRFEAYLPNGFAVWLLGLIEQGRPGRQGADVSLPRMRDPDTGVPSPTCPVAALETWLRRGKIRAGAVFRGISVHGTIEARLTSGGVRHILLRRAATAKLTVHPSERLSPHGLRAGLITEAYLAGAPDEQVAKHTRHGDLSSMRGYRRRARVTADNPARLLDL